jgi:predicted tellurium resistance membrane protein TerC
MPVTDILHVLTTSGGLAALLQVVMIDLVLAGDNAIVIGLAASGLVAKQRQRAILIGILCATALRIVFAVFTIQLLEIVGLLLAGGNSTAMGMLEDVARARQVQKH